MRTSQSQDDTSKLTRPDTDIVSAMLPCRMFMIKSNGGNGTVRDCSFTNFVGRKNAYTLNIDQHWSQLKLQPGDGVLLRDLNFTSWRGSCSDGTRRGPVQILCAEKVPCRNIRVDDFAIWTESGNKVLHKCENAYGSGVCLRPPSAPAGGAGPAAGMSPYKSTVTLTATP